MYNLSRIPEKTAAELRHMGLSQWVRDCVLHGVKFNIALTNEKGEQIFWYRDEQNGDEKVICTQSDIQDCKDKILNESETIVEYDRKLKESLKNSIKCGPTLEELDEITQKYCSKGKEQGFNEYLQNKYEGIMKQVGNACNDTWPQAQWTQKQSTQADLRTYLLTACSFILNQEVIEEWKIVGQSKNIDRLLSAEEFQGLRDKIKSYTGINLNSELDRALLKGCFFGLMDISDNETKRKTLEGFIEEAKKGVPPQQEQEKCAKYISTVAQKTAALSASTALGLEDARYSALCKVAKNCPVSVINQLISASERCANDKDYTTLCNSVAQNLSSEKVQKMTPEQIKELFNKLLPQQKNNLRRWGKGEGESEMMEGLVAAHGVHSAHGGKGAVLEETRRKAEKGVEMVKNGEKRSDSKVGKVELVGESHDKHGGSVQALMERMEKGEMGAGTVVALERKEGGEHLGMRDVRWLAEVLKHNEECKEAEKIKLPVGMEGSAIWWDAKLVNEAQKHGVQVVGVEGKDLAHDQHSPEYNTDREDHMAQQLAQLKQQGYNVVMPVGEAHVQRLQARLSANAAMETMQSMMQQNHAQLDPNKAQNPIQEHVAHDNTKQIYGKFSKQVVKNGSHNHEIA